MAGSNWNPGCSNGGPASPNSILARGLQSGNPKSHPPIDGLRVGKSMRHPQFLKKSKYVLSHRQHQTNMENNFAVAILSQSLGHLATVAGERRAQAAAWASNRSCAPDPSVLRNLCRGNTASVDWDVNRPSRLYQSEFLDILGVWQVNLLESGPRWRHQRAK